MAKLVTMNSRFESKMRLHDTYFEMYHEIGDISTIEHLDFCYGHGHYETLIMVIVKKLLTT